MIYSTDATSLMATQAEPAERRAGAGRRRHGDSLAPQRSASQRTMPTKTRQASEISRMNGYNHDTAVSDLLNLG